MAGSRRGPVVAASQRGVAQGVTLPARVGPVELGKLGKLVTVPDAPSRGQWEPGTRQWLVERRRIGPVIRRLERVTDPLFRQAGLTLE
jgi:hypothetical protein